MQKQKEAKTFSKDFLFIFSLDSAIRRIYNMDCHADSANLLAMTKYCKIALDSQSICETNRNRSNGGVAFVVFGESTQG